MTILIQSTTHIKISFKFKSFHKNDFKFVLPKILKKMEIMEISNSGIVSLPTKTQKFTVLRSPHVDKKSREQFECKTQSKVLITYFNINNAFEKQQAKLLINFIKNSTAGLNLKITYSL
jgi:ribosomal protein S10